MNGSASLERWNGSGWKLNTGTNCCFGWQEKRARERLNLEEEFAVEAYPTFVADERGRPTCKNLNFVNSCDRSPVWRNFLECQHQANEKCLFSYWMVGKFSSTASPAFFAWFGKNWPIWFLPRGDTLYQGDLVRQALWFMTRKKGEGWSFAFFRTVTFENLEISDWALLCSRGKYFRIKLALVRTFQCLASLAPSFCQPSQDFSACFRISLKLQIAPAQFPAFVPDSESEVEWKEPP